MLEMVTAENIADVERFLFMHEESSQFLINNLRAHGPLLREHHNSGNFKAIRRNGKIVSVFCLARRGNLIIQSSFNDPAVVIDACSKEPIELKGFIGDWDSVEPVYQLFRKRNGYMSEAANALKLWAFDSYPEIVRLQAYCQPENIGSKRVMEKIGMECEGLRKKSFVIRNKPVDLVHYALVKA